ncbi:hypothetical protein LCGC14_0729700 [marine sediment metagenome]|uniref:Uncharacterized protein n=1 Tax=marine sediment metagenome TaxID=412755 RepID=A0A0F9THA6_9ZZZZ
MLRSIVRMIVVRFRALFKSFFKRKEKLGEKEVAALKKWNKA